MLKRVDRADHRFAAARGRLTLSRVTMLMGTLSLVFIAATAAFIAWNERLSLFSAGRAHAEQSAFFLADHASRLFEVVDIALRATAESLSDRDLASLSDAKDVASSLRSQNDLLPYVDTLWVADAEGRIRLTTLAETPKDYSVADRRAFQQARTAGDGLTIGEPIVGHISNKTTFLVVRPLLDRNGVFRGAVGCSIDLSYFTDYWQSLDGRNDERIAIVHETTSDILVRYPPPRNPDSNRLIGAGTTAAAKVNTVSGTFEPAPHLFGHYHRVGNLPVLVSVIFKDATINALWIEWLRRVVPIMAAAFLAVLGMMAFGVRLAGREERAQREVEAARRLLSASNVRLERRVVERTAALEETNREIQRFAYIVSHDLRAPLVNIVGFTSELAAMRDELLGEKVDGEAAAETALRSDFDESIGFIRSSAEKMDGLISAILSLSRQGQRPLSPEPLDMDAIMRSIADGVAHRAMESGATIMIDHLPSIEADRMAVEQIFGNLLDNAVKYLRTGIPGRIRITASSHERSVVFEVQDNGRGISAADRDRVFELFRRAGPQDHPGDGIGLTNVRSLVRRLGGTISLESELGSGSRFLVTLPRFAAKSEEIGSPP